ncbi:MAG TPA: anti-sigma factor [Thermoleophilaceae bacterium]|nr:anti-sigma factor [Thermoleophilaceae bacterium]
MATLDQLSDEQRAIIELILQQGQSYDQLADSLGMPESRVRELAREALVRLAPITARGVEEDWRGQLADYVLGQQSGPESTATRGHLRRSEAARSWARSLLDSLDGLYGDGLPSIPDGERGRMGRAPVPAKPPGDAQPRRLAPSSDAVGRRRLLTAGGVLALILLGLLVWPIGLLTGDDDEGGSEQASGQEQAGGGDGSAAGIAVIAEQDGRRQVIVQAANLPPTQRGQAYEVWLYNSPRDARSLGAQVTDQRGTYQGAGPLPDDYRRFRFVDVSLEPIDRNRAHSGQSVLRGRVGRLRQAPANVRRGQPAILGQVVLTPPQG